MTSRGARPARSIAVGLPPFQRFLDEHRDDVYRFLVVVAGAQEADDCFQETFLSALRAYPRLRDGSNLRAWVFTIAARKAVDAHRRRARAEPVDAVPDRAAPATAEPQPELWRSVRGLADGQRSAVLLRYVADLSYAEIASALGCTEEAARQRVREGLRTLRGRVDEHA